MHQDEGLAQRSSALSLPYVDRVGKLPAQAKAHRINLIVIFA